MKPQLNSRLIRLISVILVIFTLAFLFNYLLDLEQQNTLKKEQEEDTARLLVIQAKEQEKLVLAELEKQAENERVLKILESRSVLEPGNKILGEGRWNLTLIKGVFFIKIELNAENTQELIEKYYIAVPTPVEPWTGKVVKITACS